ncbi:class F sortase [Streptomyces sp. NPDC090022]|uniref:class F sortase n=1 Tax=Streptomyces sp. NPDC090022 TaxID=3365920 RepID=UPI00381AE836
MSAASGRSGRVGLLALAVCVGVWLVTSGSAERVRPPLPPASEALGRPNGTGGTHGTEGTDGTDGTAGTAGADGATGRPGRTGGPGKDAAPLAGSRPTRIRIPAIEVDAPLTGLGLNAEGRLDVPPPTRRALAGWYRDGTTPGALGTAIVAGHVDHASGPAVFYRLGALRRGATVEIPREDGRTAVFTVHAVEAYDTARFPDRLVYGPAPRAELRVITCGGRWSPRTGYAANVVVFAHLTGTYGPPSQP